MELCSVHILCNIAGGQNKYIRALTLRYSAICLQEHVLPHEGQATRHLKVESSSVRASHTYFLNWSEYCHSHTTFTSSYYVTITVYFLPASHHFLQLMPLCCSCCSLSRLSAVLCKICLLIQLFALTGSGLGIRL